MIPQLLFGLIFTGVGYCVAFFIGKPILDDAKRSEDWPAVAGVIENSKVISKRDSDGTMYSPQVVYGYQVDGEVYQGSTVTFGGGFSSSSTSMANSVVRKYPRGKQVDVFHDPEAPGISVLEPGTGWESWIVFGAGLLFLAFGVLIGLTPVFYFLVAVVLAGGGMSRKRN